MKKVTLFIRAVSERLFLCVLSLFIAGCITTTDYRVEAFKSSRNSFVGKTIPEFEKYISNAIHIGIRTLVNGNLEKEYANFWMRSYVPGTRTVVYDCHYFYEYQPLSGLIVKFRFEEKSKNACQISGV